MEVGFDVWYKNPTFKNLKDELWLSGVVMSKGSDEEGHEVYVVRNAKNADVTVKSSKDVPTIHLRNPFPATDEENLTQLPYLNEPDILQAIQSRYKNDQVCTFVGPVLVSVNAYKESPDLSNLNLNTSASIRIRDLATSAFKQIRESFAEDAPNKTARHHSILISGDSGAGKSECSKLLLKCLIDDSAVADLAAAADAEAREHTGTTTSTESAAGLRPTLSKRAASRTFSKRFSFVSGLTGIIDKIALASVVLEAFGNAKTLLNDNSTRFGLYTQLQYTNTGLLIGGQLHTYLLEWNRLHTQTLGERNFHIFYQLVAGASEQEKAQWSVGHLKDYPSLNQGRASVVSHIDDAGDFQTLKEHLEDLELEQETMTKLFEAVVAVMQMGQVQFKATFDNNGEGCAIVDVEHFGKIAALVGLPPKDLESLLVLRNSMVIRGETFDRKMTTAHAANARHAVSAAIYKRLFKWLVNTLNIKIAPTSGTVEATVSILDMFGFRNHEQNYFEDLCMNYANEILQQHVNQQIFKRETAYFKAEGITFDSNTKIFDVASKQIVELIGTEIFGVLDEQCALPDCTDNKVAKQLYSKCEGKAGFVTSELNRTDKSFVIRHFSSSITYSMKGFIEKNTHELPSKFNQVFDTATNTVLGLQSNRHSTTPRKAAAPRRQSYFQASQVMQTFKDQLSSLVEKVQGTESQFIRCIKPTDSVYHRTGGKKRVTVNILGSTEKDNRTFHAMNVTEQLRNSGVFEAARASRTEFAVRVKHIDFYNRYRLLVVNANPTLNSELPNLFYDDAVIDDAAVAKYCQRIVELLKSDERIVKYLAGLKPKSTLKIQVGATKVFLTSTDHLAVESALNVIVMKARTVVHNFCACIITRNWFKKAIKAMQLLQRNCKMTVHRKRFVSFKNAIISLQRTFRTNKLIAVFFGSYEIFKHHIVRIQSMYRMHRCQLKLKRRQRILKIIKLNEADLKNSVTLRDHRKEKEAQDYQEWKNEQLSGVASADMRTALIRGKNVDNHLAAFRSLDEDLRMKLEAMIKSLKPIEVISKVLFDIASSKKLLGRWANTMPEGQLKMMTNRVCTQLEYGHKVLKAQKLLPANILKKMFGSKEDRTNLPVDSKHPVFDNVNNLITDLKYLVAVTDSARKSHTNSLAALKQNGNAKDPVVIQQTAQLQQAILSVNNINKFCLILTNYYVEYIPFVVVNYGSQSPYRKKFNDNKSYLNALHALIIQGRPLNEDQELFLKSKSRKQNDNQNVSVNGDFALKVRDTDDSRILQYQGLFFKYMPYAPGIEFSVNCVRSMFMTEPQVPTRVMRVKGVVHQHPKIGYYQAAVVYSDLSLQDILTTPRSIEMLEYESLSATLLTSILMGCSIVHPENVMVQAVKDAAGTLVSVKVLGMTNNFNFTEGVFDYSTLSNSSTSENFKKYGYNKYQSGCTNNNLNALFFLPQMDEPVDPVVRALFTKNGSAPEQLVSEWLKFMYLRNKGYEALSKVGFTERDFSSLKLPIYLPKRVGISMYRRLRVINSLFHPVQPRRHAADTVVPNVTHQMILSAFCPYVGKFYANQRKSFEFPEFPGLIPYNVMYTETLAERLINKQYAKRRVSVATHEDKKNAAQFVSAAITRSANHDDPQAAPQTMAQRLIKERNEAKDAKRPSVSYDQESVKSVVITAPVTPATPGTDRSERPALASHMSVKFAQIYGTPHTKAKAAANLREQLDKSKSYISLDFGGIYGEEGDFSGGANEIDEEGGRDGDEDGEEREDYTAENAGAGLGSQSGGDFDFDNIYTELDFAYDHQSTSQGKKVSHGEVIEYQSPPKREMHQERVVSFMVDVNDIYGGKDEEFDYSQYKRDDSDEEQEEEADEDEEQEEDEEGGESGEGKASDLNNQSMYSTMSDSEANASKYGEKFSFGPTVLTHDPEESDAMFNTSIAEVAAEFLANLDFERLSIENNHEVVGMMIDNLFFVTKITLYKVSEDQLNVMFGKYVKQGVISPLMKRQSAKYTTGNSGVITSQTPLKGDLIEPLLAREIVIVQKDAAKLEAIKECDVVDQLESVLGIKMTFVQV